jgi:hypothetical protein
MNPAAGFLSLAPPQAALYKECPRGDRASKEGEPRTREGPTSPDSCDGGGAGT